MTNRAGLFRVSPIDLSGRIIVTRRTITITRSTLSIDITSLRDVGTATGGTRLSFTHFRHLFGRNEISTGRFRGTSANGTRTGTRLTINRARVTLSHRRIRRTGTRLLVTGGHLTSSLVISPVANVIDRHVTSPNRCVNNNRTVLGVISLSAVRTNTFVPTRCFAHIIPNGAAFHLSRRKTTLNSIAISCGDPIIGAALHAFRIGNIINGRTTTIITPNVVISLTVIFSSHGTFNVPSNTILIHSNGRIIFIIGSNGTARHRIRANCRGSNCARVAGKLATSSIIVCRNRAVIERKVKISVIR